MKDNETPEVKIVHQPHGEEITPEKMRAGTPLSPVWPKDQYGMTSGLRRELARAAGRINGDERKLAVFIDTLRVGGKWAQDRMAVQKNIRAATTAAVMKREADAQAEAEADAARKGPQETDEERVARQYNAGVGGALPNK